MSTPKLIRYAAMLLLAAATFVPAAFAQAPEYSAFNLNEPTLVGDKILQPGSYLIRVVHNGVDRNRVQVTDLTKSKIYTTVLTVPHHFAPDESKPATQLVFFPPVAGEPRILRTWFAPEPVDDEGHDIVFEESRAKMLAKAIGKPVVSYTGPVVVAETTTPDLRYVTPEATYEPYVAPQVTTSVTETPATTQTTVTETTTTERPTQMASAELPRTASHMPLIMLLGLASLAGALVVRSVNR